MTDHTDEELIALAKKCGAEDANSGAAHIPGDILISPQQLRAFASALRQQDMARMARMREALEKAQNGIIWYSENSDDADDSDTEMLCEIDAALSETSDIQEWMDGQRAEERRSVLEELQEFFSDAVQSDFENGVKSLNEREASEFKRRFPNIWEGIIKIGTILDAAAPSARSTKGEGL